MRQWLSDHLGGRDEVTIAKRHRLRACHAGAPRPGGQRDDRHDRHRPHRPGEGGEQDQQRHVGDNKHGIGRKIEHRIGPASGITGDEADGRAENGDGNARGKTDGERATGAPDELAIDIPPHLRRAHDMFDRRRLMRAPDTRSGLAGRNDRRKQRHQPQSHNDDEAYQRFLLPEDGPQRKAHHTASRNLGSTSP